MPTAYKTTFRITNKFQFDTILDVKEKQQLSEMESYLKAQRTATVLVGVSRIIPDKEKAEYNIPGVLDMRGMRNALVRYYTARPLEADGEFLQVAQGISSWLQNNLNVQERESK